ncbi:hypothetical protein [uncultured Sulfitobacter sp.]|uniref:hypothetical protein n=1 Tax=uncultured Sulfitobacter sp. TaxID=191468 RepID=UPI00260CC32A|nr:hypothetical protein [uncultured Sulfitobacter sp.]
MGNLQPKFILKTREGAKRKLLRTRRKHWRVTSQTIFLLEPDPSSATRCNVSRNHFKDAQKEAWGREFKLEWNATDYNSELSTLWNAISFAQSSSGKRYFDICNAITKLQNDLRARYLKDFTGDSWRELDEIRALRSNCKTDEANRASEALRAEIARYPIVLMIGGACQRSRSL